MRFHFAWTDPPDTAGAPAFGPEHVVEDEQIFAFRMAHQEGAFPALEIDVVNPRVGLLGPARKRWAWLSGTPEGAEIDLAGPDPVPIFFGRLVGVPQQLQGDVVRLEFVARPADYDAQRAAVAETLRDLPWWDPVWLAEGEREDPDVVLEARPARWHIDRVSHQVSVSDILTAEDGTVLFTGADAFHDSVQVALGETPAREVRIEASVQWRQTGAGTIDLTPGLIEAFGAQTPPTIETVDGQARATAGYVCLAAGEQMLAAWPREGARIGGGWSVGVSGIGIVGQEPTVMEINTKTQVDRILAALAEGNAAAQITWGRTAVFKTEVAPDTTWQPPPYGQWRPPQRILWVPIWTFAAHMEAEWQAARSRTETVRCRLAADVQPLMTEADDTDVIVLELGPVPVDERLGEDTDEELPIGDRRRPSYFKTARGRRSFEHLLLRARAALIGRARAVEVSFETTIARGLPLSCRKGATLLDPRLPGGQATGKIKAYELSLDGATGAASAHVVIGCAVGRGGAVAVEPGEPVWCDAGYVTTGYQVQEGETHVPPAGDIGYRDYTSLAIDDDGVDLFRVTVPRHVQSVSVEGGLIFEEEAVQERASYAAPASVLDNLSQVETKARVDLMPVAGGPFTTVLEPEVTMLVIPKTIDLEAV